MTAASLLRLENVTHRFGGVKALDDVSFELRVGEVHALVGENGAGKSTLVKIVTGALIPDAGRLSIAGELVEANDPVRARELGVACIYQQPALFPDLTVAENLALGRERRPWWRPIDWSARRAAARAALSRIGAEVSPDAEARNLSLPAQQLVEIARALAAGARILIMDEPTAALSEADAERLFRIVRELRGQGVGVIYISHRLAELPKVADRVSALRDGKHVGTRAIADAAPAELIRLMVGREISTVFPKRDVPLGDAVLEVDGLRCAASGVQPTSFSIRAGEIVGIAGLVGAGRTELARVLFGITPADAGTIRVAGKPIVVDSPRAAISHGIAYVPEDRRRHGVAPELSVAENMTLAVLRRIAPSGWLNRRAERRHAEYYVHALGVKTSSVNAPVSSLSGGNQQKVALARWLAAKTRVLILDEPTQGVDVGAKAEIHMLMVELAESGLAILMISSELPEILGMSDRILVMRRGRIAGELSRAEATQERVLALALEGAA